MTRTTDEQVLLALVDDLASAQWCSGEALAARAGITRAGLARRIARLRDWGLEVEAVAGSGYRLLQPVERLAADTIREVLPTAVRERLRGLEVQPLVGSTNQQLLEAPAEADPQALFAEFQSQGRGRRGRHWQSPFGANLYLSLAWSFPAWPPQLPALSLAIGVACAQALRGLGLEQVSLKWPNDLRVGEAKLGGILIEQRGEAAGSCRVIVGVGINVMMSAGQAGALDQPWMALRDALLAAGRPLPGRNQLAAAMLAALVGALMRFESQGFAPFAAEWPALDIAAGRPVRIEGAGSTLEGIARGVDDNGALLVESAGRVHRIYGGEVSLRLTTA